MKSAYDHQAVYNLSVSKEVKQWAAHNFILNEQRDKICAEYTAPFYHPNLIIRILLFIATLLALSGVSGLLGLLIVDSGHVAISIMCMLYGIGSFVALEKMFIDKNHFKSGVTEAILYHSCGFVIGGVAGLVDFDNTQIILLACLLVFSFASWRYLDLLTTVAAIASLAGILFYNLYNAGDIGQQIIPFVLILIFGFLYAVIKKLKSRKEFNIWTYNLVVIESLSLLIIYASGNYLVVRELSVGLLDLVLEEGQNIPFAFLFYILTILIPVGYLFVGIKYKDLVLLRVSLLVLTFSVFTFKYYYSLGHTEITLTLAGTLLILLSIALMRYLKTIRNGFTGENLLSHKWQSINAEAFIVSQTMGGNQTATRSMGESGGGGDSGGGGASSRF